LTTVEKHRATLGGQLTNHWWVRWLLAFLLWSILGLLFAMPNLAAHNWPHPLLGSLAQWWSWGLVTPLIFWVDARLPFKEKQLGKRVLAQLLPSLALTTLYTYVFAAVRAVVGLGNWSALADPRLLASAFRGGILWSWLVYWLIFGALQIYRYYHHYLASELRLERMERSFSQARLNALRMQLDPHFLFNALNTVSSQVERDPRLARSMIEHLGDLLRLSLEARDRQEVPLAEEMAFLDHYTAIQRIRFGSSLRIETHIAPEVKYALVPCLIVQPLVENAIRHGISRRASGGAVTVTAVRSAEQVEIRVIDDGVGLPPGWTLENSTGLGLSVTRERIAGLHPNGSSRFAVGRRSGGGTEVEISLPLRLTGEQADDRSAR
jgi:two-component system, LytTR family, sensor kinase